MHEPAARAAWDEAATTRERDLHVVVERQRGLVQAIDPAAITSGVRFDNHVGGGACQQGDWGSERLVLE